MELGQNQVEALDLWRRVTVTTVRSDAPDLTARQMAVLMTVRLQPAPHTVRGLAATLNVGKPAITRALASGLRPAPPRSEGRPQRVRRAHRKG
jgi:DNA-binding MarR family transcriptional regulator